MSEPWIDKTMRRLFEPRDEATKAADAERYRQAAEIFLREYLYPANPIIPELEKRAVFPWDTFCAANPGLSDVALRFAREQNYELSEYQCSWACMVYRWEKLHPGERPAA